MNDKDSSSKDYDRGLDDFDEFGEPKRDDNYRVPLPPKRKVVTQRPKDFVFSEKPKESGISKSTILEVLFMVILIFVIITLLSKN